MSERRSKVIFNPLYFQHTLMKESFSLAETFKYIYETKHGSAVESISGADIDFQIN